MALFTTVFLMQNMENAVHIPISAIVITKNEAQLIGQCLRSLAWVDEVILVDSFSTDGTVEIAAHFPNVRIISSEWLGFAGTKKLAIEHSSHDWILWVDADEEVPDSLQNEIIRLFHSALLDAAYDMPRKTFFLGTWVRYSGWYPGRVCRLFNKRKAAINDKTVHEGVELLENSLMGHLQEDLLHFSYTSLEQYFRKMNYYGIYSAQELLRKGRQFHVLHLVLNPCAAFMRSYIVQLGFLDGIVGLIIGAGSAFSTFIKYANLYYLSKEQNR